MWHRRLMRLGVLLALFLASLAGLLIQRHYKALKAAQANRQAGLVSPELLTEFTAIEARERQLDDTTWATERRAESYGVSFDALWDDVNRATNKFEVLGSFPVGELLVSKYGEARQMLNQIELFDPGDAHQSWSQLEWQGFLTKAEQGGWRIAHLEFRQRSFEPADANRPDQSLFSFRADVEQTNGVTRATLEGDLAVQWASHAPGNQAVVAKLDASHLSIRRRAGPPPFTAVLTETIPPPDKWLLIDPLILYDLDGDGLSEIILAGKNLVYKRQASGQYEPAPLCKYSPGRIFTGVIADFDGDGFPDFLCAKPEGLFLFHGSSAGTFEEAPQLAWAANPLLKYGQVLTCGDVDRDGDLDIFLGQYKTPYFHGQMPTPYYDANDGDPAYLLMNDGKGHFTEATPASGLEPKRWRRSYSGSFVRLRNEDNLGLVVVSDFAGLDIYRGDGTGHLRDVTREQLPDKEGFGMAHAFADFNRDGLLDLFMVGMDSPTVDRLEHLNLWRPDAKEDHSLRARLASGNRLLLARTAGGFEQTGLSASVAHSGWSWGCSACDINNDGFPDLYIANGHESRATVRDYEPEFWLHDIYVAGQTNNRATELYFQSKFTRTRGNGYSYGGYEQNRLYLNMAGDSFLEAGYLLGVGLEQDCRNVVADDLDGDGRMDLLVTTFEVWPMPKQSLRVYHNGLTDAGNWVGFRFRQKSGGQSVVGATVTIHYQNHTATAQLLTGDSYRCQSANTLHFGLRGATHVDSAVVSWPDGTETEIKEPPINRYLTVPGNK